jgi:hypothetical protein
MSGLVVSSMGMQGNAASLAARVQATLDFYGFPEDFPVTITPDTYEGKFLAHQPWVSADDLEGLVGQVQLEFISNIVPWATCKVILAAHVVPSWADDFQRGNQWELVSVKQLG